MDRWTGGQVAGGGKGRTDEEGSADDKWAIRREECKYLTVNPPQHNRRPSAGLGLPDEGRSKK